VSVKVVQAPEAVRRAVLFTHEHPEETAEAVRAAARVAERAGCELLAGDGEAEKHAEASGLRSEADGGDTDLCVVLGGDGTILRALRRYSRTDVPVFGINFGTVGFLAAAEAGELESGLERAFAGEFDVMELPALELALGEETPIGLNDVSFTRRPHGRVAELSYSVSGQEVGHVRCDGLVAATPAGSTGYNLANQGPILAWGVEGYVVSFVAPHTLTARALVVAPDDVLQVRNAAKRDAVDIGVDGQAAGELEPGDEVEVRFHDGAGHLAQLPGSSFYRRIREKFGWLAH
jgi:NAD+ kinase